MMSARENCRRAALGLLVMCTVWLVIENGMLIALLVWTHTLSLGGTGRHLALLALTAAPLAWLAAVATFALGSRRAAGRGAWHHGPVEVPHA
jgi:hypothetical protein